MSGRVMKDFQSGMHYESHVRAAFDAADQEGRGAISLPAYSRCLKTLGVFGVLTLDSTFLFTHPITFPLWLDLSTPEDTMPPKSDPSSQFLALCPRCILQFCASRSRRPPCPTPCLSKPWNLNPAPSTTVSDEDLAHLWRSSVSQGDGNRVTFEGLSSTLGMRGGARGETESGAYRRCADEERRVLQKGDKKEKIARQRITNQVPTPCTLDHSRRRRSLGNASQTRYLHPVP